MIEKLIAFSIRNRFLVLMATLFLIIGAYWSMKNTPLDALPDLSPPQVIVKVNWAGQSPEIIEAQGTYPLVSQFLAIADIKTVRGYSTYENALIYIIFKEGTDLYWARTRVLGTARVDTVAAAFVYVGGARAGRFGRGLGL